jgi:hypothetical protein
MGNDWADKMQEVGPHHKETTMKKISFVLAATLFSTAAFVSGTTATSARSLWNHNGSIVYLIANGSLREFYYEEPRLGVSEAGARPGSLLFRGRSINGGYVGTAYIFNRRCGQFPYEVSGPILDNYERVVVQGNAPRIGSACRIWGYVNDTLEFTLLNSEATSSPSVVGSNTPSSGAAMAGAAPAGFAKYLGWWKSSETGPYLFVDAWHSFGTGGPDCKFTRFAVRADPGPDINYGGFEIDMMCTDEPQGAGNGLPARSFKPVRVHQLWTLSEMDDEPSLCIVEKGQANYCYTPNSPVGQGK